MSSEPRTKINTPTTGLMSDKLWSACPALSASAPLHSPRHHFSSFFLYLNLAFFLAARSIPAKKGFKGGFYLGQLPHDRLHYQNKRASAFVHFTRHSDGWSLTFHWNRVLPFSFHPLLAWKHWSGSYTQQPFYNAWTKLYFFQQNVKYFMLDF